MKRLVIVGGGISGTAAAWTATSAAKAQALALRVSLLERETEVGGKATTRKDGGWLFETGPLGFMSDESEVAQLADDAGLSSEIVEVGDAGSRRYIWSRGAMRNVSPHPLRFASSGILGLGGLLRMSLEPAIPKKKREDFDESVWDFAARRLGAQFADRLIHPMTLGVFAGDAKSLSLRSAFPVMEGLEREYGSLIRAQITRSRMRRRGRLPPRPSLRSFRNGIQSLPLALARRGDFDVERGVLVESMSPEPTGGFRLSLGGGRESLFADAVILSCDAASMGTLVGSFDPELASVLADISLPPVSVVGLGFSPELRRPVAPGFGVLIPRGVGYRAIGATWDSDLFPGRSGEEQVFVRVLYGGTFDSGIGGVEPRELVDIACREIRRLFETDATPIYTQTKHWPHAIPQYEIGHAERLRRVEHRLKRWAGLSLAGNSLYGTSFGKAAARGVHCGEGIVRDLVHAVRCQDRVEHDYPGRAATTAFGGA